MCIGGPVGAESRLQAAASAQLAGLGHQARRVEPVLCAQ